MAIKTDQIEQVRLKPDTTDDSATGVADAVKLADLSTIKVGDTASCEVDVTTEMVERFAALSGDYNELHLSAPVAAGYGFERPVAHGMLALSAISRLIGTELPGHGSLWTTQDVRFSAPVLAGDRIRATVTVEQVSMAAGLVALKTEVVNLSSQKTVLSGPARVRVFPPHSNRT